MIVYMIFVSTDVPMST